MAAWCHVSSDSTRGNNQRKSSVWARICKMYEQTRSENPKDIGPRNENQMKGRFKRLSENGSKWVAAYRAAYSRKTSGMNLKDVELEAHKIYEADGSKFLDLTVFNEVMCKNPKWMLNIDRDNTGSHPMDGEPNEESGGSTKRSRTTEEGEYVVHSNQETPTSGGSTIQRPIGRDAAKKKGKGKASQSITSPQIRKHRLFAQYQEAVRKDVERAFGVLQARFAFLRRPCLIWDYEQMGQIMNACIIMHNMIVEDERETYQNFDPSEFLNDAHTNGNDVVEYSTERIADLRSYMRNKEQLRNREAHSSLKNDLIEHIWQNFGDDN